MPFNGFEGNLESATLGLVNTLFHIFISVLMVRFLLPLARVNYFNPISQVLVRITDPILKPIRKIIPSAGRLDGSVLVLMIVLQFAQGWIVSTLFELDHNISFLLAYTGLTLLRMLLTMYLVFIIASAILSFIPNIRHPIVSFLHELIAPVLAPIRRVIPALGGLDFSPLIAIIAIQFLMRLLG